MNDNFVIDTFENKNCFIQEGQFKNDQLYGFGRSIKGDFKTSQIGLFEGGKLNGYGRMTTNQSIKDGLFANDEFKRIITKFEDEHNKVFETLIFNLG